jgi:hypothetical protein
MIKGEWKGLRLMLVLVNLKISGLRWLELKMFSCVEVFEMRFKFLDRSDA